MSAFDNTAISFGSDITAGNTGVGGALVNMTYNYQQPANAATVTLNNTDWHIVVDPAGSLGLLNIQFCPSPFDGQVIDVCTSQSLANLQIIPNSGQFVTNTSSFSSLGQSQKFSAIYRANNSTWYVTGSTSAGNVTLLNANNSAYVVSGQTNINSISWTIGNTVANAFVNSTVLIIGNSTINTIVNSSVVSVGANHYLTTIGWTIANATANISVVANSATVLFGNSTVNASANSTVYTATANNATYLGGTAAAGYQTTAGLSANVATLTANNATYLGGTIASGYQTTAGLAANVLLLPANSAAYLGGTIASGYQTTAGLAANVLLLPANSAAYLGPAGSATLASSYQLNSTLAGNVALLTANNTLYLGGTVAASYQLNSTLAGNVALLTANNANNLGGVLANTYLNVNANNTITVGYKVTPYSIGTITSGTVTPDANNGNYQYMMSNGPFTIAAPIADCAIDIMITNGANAGTLTVGGGYITMTSAGDTYANTFAKSASVTGIATATPWSCTWTAHGLANNQPVYFTAATIPTGMVANTTYYALVVNSSNIQISATPGGTAIANSTITTAGTTVVGHQSGNYVFSVRRINGLSALTIKALQ